MACAVSAACPPSAARRRSALRPAGGRGSPRCRPQAERGGAGPAAGAGSPSLAGPGAVLAPSPGGFCRRLKGSRKREGFKNNNKIATGGPAAAAAELLRVSSEGLTRELGGERAPGTCRPAGSLLSCIICLKLRAGRELFVF